MRFPGIAYSFQRPTDVAGPTALILSRHAEVASALSVQIFTFGDLAKDRVLVLTNLTVKAKPGAAQFVTEIQVQAFSQGESSFNVAQETPTGIVNQSEVLNWQGEVYIQGGGPATQTINIFTFFNASVTVNTMRLGLHGIIIPRGNLGGF